MARDDVLRKVWQDSAFRSLPRTAQALFAQLVTHGAPNTAGVLPFIPAKWATGCDEITEAAIRSDLSVLSTTGFVVVDATTFEVLIRAYMRESGAARHANHFKGALRCAEAVESPLLRQVLALELRTIGDPLGLALTEILVDASDSDPDEIASGSHPDAVAIASESEPNATEVI